MFNVVTDDITVENGKSTLKQVLYNCNLAECIGRSMVVQEQDKNYLAAGIIARASPVDGNIKKICLCSGKTLWQERKDLINK